jgi:murein L,D-transpeptidase YcbB/YkuD
MDSRKTGNLRLATLLLVSLHLVFGSLSAPATELRHDEARLMFARHPADADSGSELQGALQALLNSSLEEIGQTKINRAMILQIYRIGNLQAPFWVRADGLSEQSMARIKSLAKLTAQHGLRPSYYYGADINTRKTSKSPGTLAELEILLTQAYLEFLTDLKTGRVQPSDARQNVQDIEMKKNPPPVAEDIFPSLLDETATLIKVEQLRPQSVAYAALVTSLGRLRYGRSHGGWPTFSADRPTLRPGSSHQNLLGIRLRLVDLGFLPFESRAQKSAVFDNELAQAVVRFRLNNFLGDEAVIGGATYKALDISIDGAIDQVRANLEKWRFFPRPKVQGEVNAKPLPERFLFVDIGRQQLDLMADNQLVFRKRVVVGSELHGTPTMTDRITSVVVNPYWYPPNSIVVSETIPGMLASSDYLKNLGMRIFQAGKELEGEAITAIDWRQYSVSNPPPYTFRQDAGKYSALGNVKFHLTNSHAIYLHDTGNREAFNQHRRFLSHGCIRVEKPVELAAYLLQNFGLTEEAKAIEVDDFLAWFEDATIRAESIKIAPLPVFILGTTLSNYPAEPGTDPKGFLVLGPDVYGQDKRIIQAMEGELSNLPLVEPTSKR